MSNFLYPWSSKLETSLLDSYQQSYMFSRLFQSVTAYTFFVTRYIYLNSQTKNAYLQLTPKFSNNRTDLVKISTGFRPT